jgi:hypothetical protein
MLLREDVFQMEVKSVVLPSDEGRNIHMRSQPCREPNREFAGSIKQPVGRGSDALLPA